MTLSAKQAYGLKKADFFLQLIATVVLTAGALIDDDAFVVLYFGVFGFQLISFIFWMIKPAFVHFYLLRIIYALLFIVLVVLTVYSAYTNTNPLQLIDNNFLGFAVCMVFVFPIFILLYGFISCLEYRKMKAMHPEFDKKNEEENKMDVV